MECALSSEPTPEEQAALDAMEKKFDFIGVGLHHTSHKRVDFSGRGIEELPWQRSRPRGGICCLLHELFDLLCSSAPSWDRPPKPTLVPLRIVDACA